MSIPATLTISDVCNRPWDVIVIGAGPAGSMAARKLARHQAHVLLVDKALFPRFKVCGCCLNGRALSVLAAAGLGGLVERFAARKLDRLRIGALGWQAEVAIEGRSLSRETFDAALVDEAIRSGAHFLPGTKARLGPVTALGRTVLLRKDGADASTAAQVVLGADGLSGQLLAGEAHHDTTVDAGSRVGAGVILDHGLIHGGSGFYCAGSIFMACGRGGYLGLVRLEDDRLNLAAAFDVDFVKRSGGLGKAAASILRGSGLPGLSDLDNLPWHGTPLLTRRVSPPAAERVLLLGDAAGYVEPFTGEGMAWALSSGEAAAALALRASRGWQPSYIKQWSWQHRQIVDRRQWVCRAVANLLRHPHLMRAAVALLARFPILARPVVRYLNCPPW